MGWMMAVTLPTGAISAIQNDGLNGLLLSPDFHGLAIRASFLTALPSCFSPLSYCFHPSSFGALIRGVLPEGFPATAKRIESLIRSPNQAPIQSGFSISPDWFKQFDITKVPAFVSVKSGRCLPEQPCSNADYDILYGNISLYQALDYLATGDAQQNIHPLLHTLYSQ
uniref:Putative conjugative transfer protein n=1 Tax=Vibrio harveyi TaxID=669 RepID=E5G5L5_VIBHA|nr:putative conjugative transfer protein [Vibrio harveyi]